MLNNRERVLISNNNRDIISRSSLYISDSPHFIYNPNRNEFGEPLNCLSSDISNTRYYCCKTSNSYIIIFSYILIGFISIDTTIFIYLNIPNRTEELHFYNNYTLDTSNAYIEQLVIFSDFIAFIILIFIIIYSLVGYKLKTTITYNH